MAEVIGVRFKDVGKIYYFDPGEIQAALDQQVIVETARGVECGTVAIPNRQVEDDEVVKPLKKLIRIASPDDLHRIEENRKKERKAFRICQEKISANKLDMKLVDVEYTFDNNKILFYFTAEGRVDFRELVKDLASVFRTRIELRQIGVRDEAKMLGGLGICGRPFCCSSFLGEFQPVSIKMAKEQGLSLNPTKISGTCGRLMCCLKYEQAAYEDLIRTTPKLGALVDTAEGRGTVTEISLLTGMIKVHLEKDSDGEIKVFDKKDVTILRNGKAKPEPRTEDKAETDGAKPAKESRKQDRKGNRREGGRAPRGEKKDPIPQGSPEAPEET